MIGIEFEILTILLPPNEVMPHRLQQKVASDMGKWWILGSSTFSNLNLNHSDFIQELGPVLSLCLADSENKGHSTVI